MCVCGTQHSIAQNRSDNLRLILVIMIIAKMLSIGGEGVQPCVPHTRQVGAYAKHLRIWKSDELAQLYRIMAHLGIKINSCTVTNYERHNEMLTSRPLQREYRQSQKSTYIQWISCTNNNSMHQCVASFAYLHTSNVSHKCYIWLCLVSFY